MTRGRHSEGRDLPGLRPVLILSNDLFYRRSGTVIAMAITSQPQRAGFPLTFALTDEKLSKPSWVKISQVRTISVERHGKRMGALEKEDLDRILDGLVELIG
jgi:mRNA interferase MazF